MNGTSRSAFALVLVTLPACEPPAESPADPAKVLEECELPEPCEAAAYDLCAVSGPDEAAIRCVLAALSETGPVHVSAHRTTVCGDVPDSSAIDIFRWQDGTTTCLSWAPDGTPEGMRQVYACEPLTRAECRDVAADAPLPELCLDFRNWAIAGGMETEAACH